MIVVTGAAGFIGSQLALALRAKGVEDLILVDHPLRPEKEPNLEPLQGLRFTTHTEFIEGFERGEFRPRLVFHLGACSDTTASDWGFLAENNLDYSRRVWCACARAGARLIYASSAATYGDGSHGFDDEADIATLQPLNLYARSKHEFDLWALEQAGSGAPAPAQWAGLKFFNVFGPGEAHKARMASMVYHGFQQMVAQGRIRLFQSHRLDFADGGQARDFVYVKDAVAVMEKIAAHPEINGIFNVGTGAARSFNDLAHALGKALGREARIEYIPMPEDLQGRYQYFTQATMEKLTAAGGGHTFLSLEDSVGDYVRNHLQLKEAKG